MAHCITSSVLDIFRIGPGPSSSHTIGPMCAARNFMLNAASMDRSKLSRAKRVVVDLYGSLALTGKGHGTDRAIAAGLFGQEPETCDIDFMHSLLRDPKVGYDIPFADGKIRLDASAIVMHRRERNPYRFANAMKFTIADGEGASLYEEVWYSVGGGAIERECGDESEGDFAQPCEVPYRYRDWGTFLRLSGKYGLSPAEIAIENEKEIAGCTEEDVRVRIRRILDAMNDSVERGLSVVGTLPGPLRLERRAEHVRRLADDASGEFGLLARLDAYALAAAEENAAGNRVVTAPTGGASGLFAGVVHFLRNDRNVPQGKLEDALLVAGVIGTIAKNNASISGAEVGCQGEVGVASCMAAAMIACTDGLLPELVGVAAEIAMEHHLGLTCDPVDGYVQIPCIERNAVGACTAFNAAMLARLSTPGKQKVTLDEAFAAMLETGRGMNAKFRETALGGLAACALCD